MTNYGNIYTATITAGASLSAAVEAGIGDRERRLAAIEMPEAFTGTSLTFQVSIDGGTTFKNAYGDGGAELSLTVGDKRVVLLRADAASQLGRVTHLKVRSGTSGTPQVETETRAIRLLYQ